MAKDDQEKTLLDGESIKISKDKALIMLDLIKELKELRQVNKELREKNMELVIEKNSLISRLYTCQSELIFMKKTKREQKVLNHALHFFDIIVAGIKDQNIIKHVQKVKVELLSNNRLTVDECLEIAESMNLINKKSIIRDKK